MNQIFLKKSVSKGTHTKNKLSYFLVLSLTILCFGGVSAQESPPEGPRPQRMTHTIQINPTGTYLRTNMDVTHIYNDRGKIIRTLNISPATSFNLAENEILPGDELYITRRGDFNYSVFQKNAESTSLIAVFFGGGFLRPANNEGSTVSLPTAVGGLPTDIPQDFHVKGGPFCTRVTVPSGAQRVLFSPNDSFFSDNFDPDGDFRVDAVVERIAVKLEYSQPIQSVLSSQIDLNSSWFGAYDLVAEKSFVIRTAYKKMLRNIDPETEFRPILKIGGRKITNLQCLVLAENTARRLRREKHLTDCSFKISDFGSEGFFRQDIVFPGGISGDDQSLYFELSVQAGEERGGDPSCLERDSRSFDIQFRQVNNPTIGIVNLTCTSEDTSICTSTSLSKHASDYRRFINPNVNTELALFKSMFPVSESFDIKKNFLATAGGSIEIPATPLKGEAQSMFKSRELKAARSRTKVKSPGRIVFVTPDEIFERVLGLKKVAATEEEEERGVAGVAYQDFLVGYVKSSGYSEGPPTGTFLHEVAHLFGQDNEFYNEGSDSSQCLAHHLQFGSNDDRTYERACHTFSGFTGYDTRGGVANWSPVFRDQSIMSGGNNVNNMWIDRQTYIKAFRVFSGLESGIPRGQGQFQEEDESGAKITLVSGVYNSQAREFRFGEVQHYGTGFIDVPNEGGPIKVMLKNSSGEVISSIASFSETTDEEVLLRGGGGYHNTLPFGVVVAAFPYTPTATQVVIMREDGNGEQTMLFSQEMPEDNNPDFLLSSIHSNTNANFRNVSGINLIRKENRASTSATFTKFKYATSTRIAFDYNACSDQAAAGNGLALLLGKSSSSYESLPSGNQGVVFDNQGVSLHLDSTQGLVLRDGSGGVLVQNADYTPLTQCDEWRKLKVRVYDSGKIVVLQGAEILLSYQLDQSVVSDIDDNYIGFSAYSQASSQFRVGGIKINRIPFPRD